MSDFDALQAAIQRHAEARLADEHACEACLNALYHALRRASGPGQPLNNVSLEFSPDPGGRLRPPPVGAFHAAWLRLGLCEVFVRVRRVDGAFHGEYGEGGVFRLPDLAPDTLTALARQLLRGVAAQYTGLEETGPGESGGALN